MSEREEKLQQLDESFSAISRHLDAVSELIGELVDDVPTAPGSPPPCAQVLMSEFVPEFAKLEVRHDRLWTGHFEVTVSIGICVAWEEIPPEELPTCRHEAARLVWSLLARISLHAPDGTDQSRVWEAAVRVREQMDACCDG